MSHRTCQYICRLTPHMTTARSGYVTKAEEAEITTKGQGCFSSLNLRLLLPPVLPSLAPRVLCPDFCACCIQLMLYPACLHQVFLLLSGPYA